MLSLNIWDKFEDLLPPTDFWLYDSEYARSDDVKFAYDGIGISEATFDENQDCFRKLLTLDDDNGEIDSSTINPNNLEIKLSEKQDHSYCCKIQTQGIQKVQKNNSRKTIQQVLSNNSIIQIFSKKYDDFSVTTLDPVQCKQLAGSEFYFYFPTMLAVCIGVAPVCDHSPPHERKCKLDAQDQFQCRRPI